MSHGGKGDTPRPISVDQNTFASNWEATFGKKKKEVDDTVVDTDNKENLPKDSEQGG